MIYPVILCGGSGTRLWPLSRKNYPKQFANLSGDTSLFQQTLKRVSGPGFEAPILMTNSDYRFTVQEQAEDVGITEPSIIIEPESRNTAPAILSAALKLEDQPEAVLLVMPSDHLIKNEDAFSIILETAYFAAQVGKLVTFGVKPTRAETGYGYLEVADKVGYEHASALPLTAFVEKPNALTAEEYVRSGRYLWNAGIFIWSVRSIIKNFKTQLPAMYSLFQEGNDAYNTANETDFIEQFYGESENISIDFGIMEKASNVYTLPVDFGWNDLGTWGSLYNKLPKDKQQNAAVGGETIFRDAANNICLLYTSPSPRD